MTTGTRYVVATRYGGPEVLEIRRAPMPEPGPGEARVRIRAAGVNPADLKARSGDFGADPADLPRRLGFEVAGVVDAVGPGVDTVEVGQEVIAFRVSGGYAADLVVGVTALTPKPASIGWAEAGGLMLTGATAAHLLTATAVEAGDVVLVHGGSGGVGQMVVQLARLRGARVIATASPRNHALLRDLGAEPVAYGEGLLERVRALAGGPGRPGSATGIDVALDLVGSDEAMEVSLALVPGRDRIATIANFTCGARERIRLLGGGPGADPGTEVRDAARPELARLAGTGELRVAVAATFPLEEVAEAHRFLADSHPGGKVVLLP